MVSASQQKRGSLANFCRFGIILKTTGRTLPRHVTEPTREQRNRANRPTRLVPTTPLPIRGTKQIRFIQTLSHLGVVFVGSPSYKVTFVQIRSSRMAKKATKRRAWTPEHVRTLKTLARKKTHAARIAKTLKRSEGATRQKAFSMGLSLDSRV